MDLLGLSLSFTYVILILFGAYLLKRYTSLSSAVTRKIIHIAVGNWWFILMHLFTRIEYAVIGPMVFILFNYLSNRYHLLPAMELEDARKSRGTIYYPISLLVLVIAGYTEILPLYIGGIGILVMSYGDGFAALIGQGFGAQGIPILGGRKSLIGSMTMLIFSTLVIAVMTVFYYPGPLSTGSEVLLILATASIATLLELFTPCKLDNLTVPIGSALFYALLVGLI